MRAGHRVGRIGWMVLVAWCGSPIRAHADEPERQACIESYVAAQTARKDGELVRAHRSMAECARDVCPGMIKRDCVAWGAEVGALIPSIVLAAEDDHGHVLGGARAWLDGRTVPLDGVPLELDAGKHTLRFEHDGDAPQDRTLVLVERQRGRRVTAIFPIRVQRSQVPLTSYVLGGVGVVALGVFTFFSVRGTVDRNDLGCNHGCVDADYNQVNREYLVADGALVVGVVSLGLAVTTWLISRPSSARSPAAAQVAQWPIAAW